MDILCSEDAIGLLIGDLEVDCVLLIKLKDSATGHLVQEALIVLIIAEHNGLAVLVQSHQSMSSIYVDAVCVIVD